MSRTFRGRSNSIGLTEPQLLGRERRRSAVRHCRCRHLPSGCLWWRWCWLVRVHRRRPLCRRCPPPCKQHQQRWKQLSDERQYLHLAVPVAQQLGSLLLCQRRDVSRERHVGGCLELHRGLSPRRRSRWCRRRDAQCCQQPR